MNEVQLATAIATIYSLGAVVFTFRLDHSRRYYFRRYKEELPYSLAMTAILVWPLLLMWRLTRYLSR